MSMMPNDRSKRHHEILRRVGIPGKSEAANPSAGDKAADSLANPLSSLAPLGKPASKKRNREDRRA